MLKIAIAAIIVALLGYTFIGCATRVHEIKDQAPKAIEERGWKIMRYEGYQWGAWGHHGGKVWYHVQDVKDATIQYRIYITKWGGELHFTYGQPEILSRINIDAR